VVGLVDDDQVEEVAREEREPALHLLDVGDDNVGAQTVLFVGTPSLQRDDLRQRCPLGQNVAELIEGTRPGERVVGEAVFDGEVGRNDEHTPLRNAERRAGDEPRLPTPRRQHDDGGQVRRTILGKVVAQGHVAFGLRRAQPLIADDADVRLLPVLADRCRTALAKLLHLLGARRAPVPFRQIARVAERLQVEGDVLAARRKRHAMVEMLEQLFTVDHAAALRTALTGEELDAPAHGLRNVSAPGHRIQFSATCGNDVSTKQNTLIT